jgi:hypothetical protein
LVKKHENLGNLLIERLDLFKVSEVVTIELLSAARNFTSTLATAKLISPNLLQIPVNLCINAQS